jgi:hypothetical protein
MNPMNNRSAQPHPEADDSFFRPRRGGLLDRASLLILASSRHRASIFFLYGSLREAIATP